MTSIGSRELKNRLGRYLVRAKRGETIIVTVRGEPIAKLTPVSPPKGQESMDAFLDRLEAEGMITRGRLPFRDHEPVHATGKPASQIIIDERE